MRPRVATVELRPLEDADLDAIFAFQADPDAAWMMAFGPADPHDRVALDSHWRRVLADAGMTALAILADGELAGHIGAFPFEGERDIGFLVGRAWWGRGIATAALGRFLEIERTRPLHARAVTDNVASLRVLAKCGFRVVEEAQSYAEYRQAEVSELVTRLDPDPSESAASAR